MVGETLSIEKAAEKVKLFIMENHSRMVGKKRISQMLKTNFSKIKFGEFGWLICDIISFFMFGCLG